MSTSIAAVNAIALGVSDVIPIEITSAYSAIANNGILNKPNAIVSIEDRHGRVIKRFLPDSKEIKDENIIYILTNTRKYSQVYCL